MKKLVYYIGFFVVVLTTTLACGRKLAPGSVITKDGKSYDAAAFNYFYVEAIKQKLMGNSGDALQYFEQCIKINPESDAAYFQMAQIANAGGDNASAKRLLSKAITIDKQNLWYLMMLAEIYYKDKNLDSAIIYYEKAVQYAPDKEDLQLNLGNLYAENKNYDKAKSVFDSFDKKYGINETSTLSAIKSLMASGNFDEALVKTNLLIKEYPDEFMYRGILAEIYQGKGDNIKALDVYKQLIEKDPLNPQTQLSFCDFLITQKSWDELFQLLNAVILNNNISREDKISLLARLIELPDLIKVKSNNLMLALMVMEANFRDDDIVMLLRPELLVKIDKLPDAIIRLNEIIKTRPDNYYAWEKLLLAYLQAGDYKDLFTKGEECATKFNRSFLAKILYANGAIETGKYEIALEELRKAEILAGDNQASKLQILTMKADIYYRMKNFEKAFLTYDEAVKENDNDVTLLNNYAYYLAEQNQKLKEAEEMSKKVIRIEKGNNTYLDTYGWVLYKRGKLSEAAKVFEEIIASGDKPDAVWYEHYGFILKKMKNCTKAVENWNIAIKLDNSKSNLLEEINNCKR